MAIPPQNQQAGSRHWHMADAVIGAVATGLLAVLLTFGLFPDNSMIVALAAFGAVVGGLVGGLGHFAALASVLGFGSSAKR